MIFHGAGEYPIRQTSFGIGLVEIGERKNVGRVKRVVKRMSIARGLGETEIETA